MNTSIFISHSWKDKSIARRIGNTLIAAGIKVWIDEANIKIGDSLIRKIREGIDGVDFIVAIISKNSINSEWVTKELDIAMNQEIKNKNVKVLPVLLDDSTLPGFLEGKLYADVQRIGFKAMMSMLLDKCGKTYDNLTNTYTSKKIKIGDVYKILSNGTYKEIQDLLEKIDKKDEILLLQPNFYAELEKTLYRINNEGLFLQVFSMLSRNSTSSASRSASGTFLADFLDDYTNPTRLTNILSYIGKPNRLAYSNENMDLTILYKVLDVLKLHISPEIDAKCLDFFIYEHSKLDEILAIELEAVYSRISSYGLLQFLEAKWMEVLINIHVSCPYEKFDAIDTVFSVWEKSIQNANKYVVRYIVSALSRHYEDEDLMLFQYGRSKRLKK